MPVCIAGMHRSGTSMVTEMLRTSGLYLGPESDLMPGKPENREPHWENKRFVEINIGILAQLYGAWDCPPPIPEDWTSERLSPYRTQAEAVLAEFDGREPWGWKDPRNCLTLPFWQALLGSFPVVIVVRNPLEVAKSLRARNGFSYALGMALWQAYNQRLHESAARGNRIVTHYDNYFRDPGGELRRILNFLGLSVDENVIEKVRAVHLADLRHHEMTTQHLRIADVSPAVLDLYHNLCTEAMWRDDRLGPADAGTIAALTEAMVRSGEDPDSPESTPRARQRRGAGGQSPRRGQIDETEPRPLERKRRRQRDGWLSPNSTRSVMN